MELTFPPFPKTLKKNSTGTIGKKLYLCEKNIRIPRTTTTLPSTGVLWGTCGVPGTALAPGHIGNLADTLGLSHILVTRLHFQTQL